MGGHRQVDLSLAVHWTWPNAARFPTNGQRSFSISVFPLSLSIAISLLTSFLPWNSWQKCWLSVGLSLETWPWPWSHRFGWVPLRVQCYMVGSVCSVCSVRSSDIIICWFWAIEAVSSSVTTAQRIAWLLLFFGYLFFNLNSFIILTCFGYAWFAYNVKYVPIKIAKNMIKTVCKFWWKHTNLFISQNEQQQKSANW